MAVKSEADWRSEQRRRRKRAAVNRHLHVGHGVITSGTTTEERLLLHSEIHESPELLEEDLQDVTVREWMGYDHEHQDPEDWEELEEMNSTWRDARRRQRGSNGSDAG